MSINLHNADKSFGGVIFTVAEILSGSALTPSLSTIWSKNFTALTPNFHLSLLQVILATLIRSKVDISRWSCSA